MNINKKKSLRNVKQPTIIKKTLDIQHVNHIENLKQNKVLHSQLKVRLEILDKTIADMEIQGVTEDEIQSLIQLKDDRIHVFEEMHALSSQSDIGYYTNTADILFKYYELVENKCETPPHKTTLDANRQIVQAVSTGQAVQAVQAGKGPGLKVTSKSLNILNFLSVNKAPKCEEEQLGAVSLISSGSGSLNFPAFLKKSADGRSTQKDNRGSLLDRYMECIDTNYIKLVEEADAEYHVCQHCLSDHVTMMTNDGYIVCNECQSVEYIIVDHDKPSYKDPPKEISYFAYKRINHFNEWLNQIQGKETTDIPEDVYDKILLEIRKQKITNMADISHKRVKDILKKLGINKYYEHIPHIINRLNGLPMPHLSPDLEEKLRNMFKQIQGPFLKHAPPERKNFLSYSYVLHKSIQLLERDEFLSNFPLLKSREKLSAQDKIWENICKDIGWQFIPSI